MAELVGRILKRIGRLAAAILAALALGRLPRLIGNRPGTTTPSSAEADDDYRLYIEYADFLRDRHAESSRSFDKALAALAGGALALSITFVNVIAPTPSQKVLLGLAWGLFATALLVNLLSFFFAERDYFHSIQGLNGDFEEGRFPGDLTPTRYEKLVPLTNVIGLAAFVLGLVFLVVFALANLGGN